MRDDSILYSGANSLSIEREQPQRREAREQKQQKRQQLLPSADVVLVEISKAIEQTRNIGDIDVQELSPEDLKVELLARRKQATYLENLKNKLQNILRKKEQKQ